ncbi:MAG: transglutaminaseTgpA domain-containing protein [Actinomycetota bacterium]|nr:transglutaminaseTgpA domain-containing protein [Actinomycetota bacterium]
MKRTAGAPVLAMKRGNGSVRLVAGGAVLASAPALTDTLQGWRWLACAALSVAVVVLVGFVVRLAHRPWWAVASGQLAAVLVLVTVLFSRHDLLGVLPGPASLAEQLAALGAQIDTGIPPLPATEPLLLLVCLAYGVLAIVADALTAAGYGPAACGLLLLAAYTVSTTLDRDALPDWTLACGAAGFAVLLVTDQRRRQGRRGPDPAISPDGPSDPDAISLRRLDRVRTAVARGSELTVGLAVTACALAVALLVGVLASAVGTEGRFPGNNPEGGANQDTQFGLNPFTSIRGQLAGPTPKELLRVHGLPSTTYLRALTLSKYVPREGWQLPRRRNDAVLDATLPTGLATPPAAPSTTIEIDNVGYRDRWLPLAGLPLGVTGVVPGRWHYDVTTATAYTSGPVTERRWVERAVLLNPPAEALNAVRPTIDVDPTYLDNAGLDPRIGRLTAVVIGRARTPFAKAAALNRYFLDPANGFRYSLTTAPGNSGDALVDFLERGKVGYCEQFASAMAVMLRTVGVPSRVAVGFTSGRDTGGARSIGTADAHAWVEAFFPGYGWLTFDPTPLGDGRSVTPGYLADIPLVPPADRLTPPAGGQGANPAAKPPPEGSGGAPRPVPQDAGGPNGTGPNGTGPNGAGQLAGGGSDGAADGSGTDPSGKDGPPDIRDAALLGLLVAFAILAMIAAPATVRRVARYRRHILAGRGGPAGAAAAWREVLAESVDRGGPPPGNSTVRVTARRLVLSHRIDAPSSHAVRAVVDAVERGWYAPPTNCVVGAELVEALREASAGLGRAAPLRLPDRLWPRSVRPRLSLLTRLHGTSVAVVERATARGNGRRHATPRDEPTRGPAG